MRLTWEKIKRSLGIPDKLTDAEAADGIADAQTSPEYTGRNQPQIESGPWGDLAAQDGPRQYAGIPEAVTDNALYSGRGATPEAGPRDGGGVRFGMAKGAQGVDLMKDWQQRGDDGVLVTPTPITLGETVHVKYSGSLAKSGDSQVHLHWGFGPGQWTHVQDVAMERDGDGYAATLNVDKDGRFEFCFHDNEGNWDNNDGRNWSYIIHDGELPGEYVVD